MAFALNLNGPKWTYKGPEWTGMDLQMTGGPTVTGGPYS